MDLEKVRAESTGSTTHRPPSSQPRFSTSHYPTSSHMQKISIYVQSLRTQVLDFLRHLHAPLTLPPKPPGSKDLDSFSEPVVPLKASTRTLTPQPLLNHRTNSPTTRKSLHCVNKLPEEPTQLSILTPTDECESESTSYSAASQQSQQSSNTPPSNKLQVLKALTSRVMLTLHASTPSSCLVPFSHLEHRRPINYLRLSLHPDEVASIFEKLLTSRRFLSLEKLATIIPDPYTAPLVRLCLAFMIFEMLIYR